MKARILFVVKDFKNELLGIAFLSAILKKGGHEVGCLNCSECKDLTELAKKFRPDVICYSTTTGIHNFYLKINKEFKAEMKFLSVFGGPHPTFFPEIIKEDGVDAVCIGEGEEAVLELCNKIAKKENIFNTRNFWFKKGGRIIKNRLRPLIRELDSLPDPDRDILYESSPDLKMRKMAKVCSARGCPFECTYCFNHVYKKLYDGNLVRHRSVDRVIREIKSIKKDVQFIDFVDDIFTLSIPWLREFAEKYPREVDLPFHCGIRPNLVTEEVIMLLKKAGCHSIAMAIESGNDKIRYNVLNRHITNEQILRAAKIIKRHGIRLFIQNMIGLPNETLDNMFETLYLNKKCRSAYSQVSIYQPYPRTELGEYCIKNGLYNGNPDMLSETFHNKTGIKLAPPLKGKHVVNLHHLFAIGVEFPFFIPLIKVLIRFPENIFYNSAYNVFRGYCLKTRIYNFRLTPREFVKTLSRFLGQRG